MRQRRNYQGWRGAAGGQAAGGRARGPVKRKTTPAQCLGYTNKLKQLFSGTVPI